MTKKSENEVKYFVHWGDASIPRIVHSSIVLYSSVNCVRLCHSANKEYSRNSRLDVQYSEYTYPYSYAIHSRTYSRSIAMHS